MVLDGLLVTCYMFSEWLSLDRLRYLIVTHPWHSVSETYTMLHILISKVHFLRLRHS